MRRRPRRARARRPPRPCDVVRAAPHNVVRAGPCTSSAIEAICAREGLPLPAGHPGPRLEHVTIAGDAVELRVIVASRVGAGEPLARVDAVVLRSPWAGVVSALDHEPPRLRITIRREPGPAAG